MKKLSILVVSIFLMVALATTASAQLSTDVTGRVGAAFLFTDNNGTWELSARGHLQAALSLKAGNSEAVISVNNAAGFGGNIDSTDAWKSFFGDAPYEGSSNLALSITSAKLISTGAWWKNGPEVTTTVGKHNVSYSPWVANGAGVHGVEISGVNLGDFAAKGYYGWTADDKVMVANLNGSVADVNLNATLIRYDATPKFRADYALAIGYDGIEDVSLNATVAGYAGIGLRTVAFEAKATVNAVDNLEINGLIKSIPVGFVPKYRDTGNSRPYDPDTKSIAISAKTTQKDITLNAGLTINGKPSDADYSQRVIDAGASTTFEGISLSAALKLTNTNNTSKKTETTLSASTDISGVVLSWEGKLEKVDENAMTMKNTVNANTTVDTPFADGVALGAQVVLENGQYNFGVDADWTAPNGVNLGVHFANYDRNSKHNGIPFNVPNTASGMDGFYVTATKVVYF